MKRFLLTFFIVGLLCSAMLGRHSPLARAQAATGAVAYVRADTGDEIRLINPDGTNDRHLWSHGIADPLNVYNVYSTTWRPDAGELTFASTHENWCSINYSDVFSVAPDGSRYRRITQAPACGDLAAYPRGTVRLPVKNVSVFGNSFTGFVYVQGAPSLQPVSLAAGASTVVVFDNVADFGDGAFQLAAVIDGANREYAVGTAVDVQSGASVTAGSLPVAVPENKGWEPRSPTWREDGAILAYAYGYNALFGIPAQPSPVEFGERVADPSSGPNIVEYVAYGPRGARSNQILFEGYDGSYGIYLVDEGSTGAAQALVQTDYDAIRGLAWLPDGSGFLYSVEEEQDYEIIRANVFAYSFVTNQSTRLTNFATGFTGQISVSPDSGQIVFDMAQTRASGSPSDVWIMNRDGSGQRVFIQNAYAPSWSPGALPPPLTPRAFLPLVSH